ncbi:MAG: hypothetical protein AAFQ94_09765 [Bacteroidota bacterium]
MNKQKFIELLREPSSISKDELSGLENVTRQYPYFQSAHLLLAKGSRIRKDPNTKKRISSAAVYCTDRTLLKKYISGDMIFLDSVKKPPINVNEELPEKKAKKLVRPATKKAASGNSVQTEAETPQAADLDTSHDSDFNPDSILDEIKGGLASYKANKKHFEEYLKEEEEDKAVNEAISKAEIAEPEIEMEPTAEKEVLPETDQLAVEDIDDEIPTVAETPVDIEDIEVDSEPEKDEIEFDISGIIEEIKNDEAAAKESKQAEEPQIQPEQNLAPEIDSTEPLEKEAPEETKSIESTSESTAPEEEPKKSGYSNKIVISGSNKPKTIDEETSVKDSKPLVESVTEGNKDVEQSQVDDSSSETADNESNEVNPATGLLVSRDDPKPDPDENLSPGELRKAKMKRLKMQKEIIDDFIDTTPQMPKPSRKSKPVEEKTEDLSAPSQVAKTEIISENMAIIYKNQGKLDKAVEIYNKLILKFPEKEAYFVTRIKELK